MPAACARVMARCVAGVIVFSEFSSVPSRSAATSLIAMVFSNSFELSIILPACRVEIKDGCGVLRREFTISSFFSVVHMV